MCVQVAELEAQAAAEPVPAAAAAAAGEKEATSQSVEQLEAQVQTKDQVSQGQAPGSCPRPCLPGTPGPSEQTQDPLSLGDPDFEESELGDTRSS